MTARGHLVLALTPLFVTMGYDVFSEPSILIATSIGSLLPDIDEPRSYIGRKLIIISTILKYMGLRHRGVTHFLVVPVFIMLLSYITAQGGFFFWIGFGILMHDIGDMLTKGGIHGFLMPFDDRQVGILPKEYRFYTNSLTEHLFIILLLCIDILFLVGLKNATI